MTIANGRSIGRQMKKRENNQRKPQQHPRLVAGGCGEGERRICRKLPIIPFFSPHAGIRSLCRGGPFFRVPGIHPFCMRRVFLRHSTVLRTFRQSYQDICQATTAAWSDHAGVVWVWIASWPQPFLLLLVPVSHVSFVCSNSMPSTHSAVMFFYAGAVILTSTTLPIHSSLSDHSYIRVWPPVVVGTSAVVVALSRVWRGHHDFLQIAAGSMYGAACSVIAYEMWINGLYVYGHSLERWLDAFLGWR